MIRRWSLCLGWLVAACTATPTPPQPIETATEPATAVPANTPSLAAPTSQATRSPSGAAPTPFASPGSGPATLKLWMTPDFAPDPQTPSGAEFLAQLDGFSTANPGVTVEVRVKSIGGAGGIIDSMRTAAAAAPGALPDVIAVGIPTLANAARDGLLLPLDDQLPAETLTDFFAAILEPARMDGQLMGLPFASDAQVLVYSTALYARPPATWADVVQGDGPFLFPAADQTSLTTLHQYIALGGLPVDETGNPTLEAEPLQQLFDYYAETRAAGLISPRSLTSATDAEAWAAYRDLDAALAVTSAHAYLTERDLVVDTDATVIPTRDGNRLALTETWYFALARTDASRQPLALALMEWLTSPENLASWTLLAGHLPTRAAAVASWPDGNLAAFAAEVQAAARPRPSATVLSALGPPLAVGVDRILRGQTTPPAAAEAVLDALVTP